MCPELRQKQMRQPQQEHAAQPTWTLRLSGESHRHFGHLYASGGNKQRLPVTPAIWVIIWTSVMVGYAGGYSDGASLLSHTTKPYRELFFPHSTKAATVPAAHEQQQLYRAGHPKTRLSEHHFTGIAWDNACQQDLAPPSLVLMWQLTANIVVLPIAAWQARIYGRKAAVITGCCLQALGVALKALSWHLAQLAVGYAIEGLGRGILWLAIAVEDAEIAPATLRGCFISCNLLGTALGFLSAVAVFWEPRLQRADYGWRVATALNALPATVVVLLLPWFSESPNSLIQRGKLAEGREALMLIRGPFYDPTQELMDIVKGAGTDPFAGSNHHGSAGDTTIHCPGSENNTNAVSVRRNTAVWFKLQLVAFQQRQHYLPLLVSCVLSVLSTIVGLTVEYSMLNLVTGDWVFTAKEYLYTTVFIIAGIEVVGAAIAMCVVDWIGRRGLWISSSLIGATCWIALAALSALGQMDTSSFSTFPSASSAIAMLALLMFAHFAGPFMLLPILATELHHLVVRTSAAAVVLLAAFSTRIMMLGTVYQTMCTLQWRVFVLLAVACVTMLVIVTLLLPETKKVPLERIGGVWQKHWLWRKWLGSAAADADVV